MEAHATAPPEDLTAGPVRTGVVVVGRDGVIQLWAGEIESLLGHAPSDVLQRSLDVIVPPAYRQAHWTGFNAAMASGHAGSEAVGITIPVQCADRSVKHFPGRFTLIRDAAGRAVAAAAVITEPRPDDLQP